MRPLSRFMGFVPVLYLILLLLQAQPAYPQSCASVIFDNFTAVDDNWIIWTTPDPLLPSTVYSADNVAFQPGLLSLRCLKSDSSYSAGRIESSFLVGIGLFEISLKTAPIAWETLLDLFAWRDTRNVSYDLFRIAVTPTYVYTALSVDMDGDNPRFLDFAVDLRSLHPFGPLWNGSLGFHSYSLLWTDTAFNLFLDNVRLYTISRSSPALQGSWPFEGFQVPISLAQVNLNNRTGQNAVSYISEIITKEVNGISVIFPVGRPDFLLLLTEEPARNFSYAPVSVREATPDGTVIDMQDVPVHPLSYTVVISCQSTTCHYNFSAALSNSALFDAYYTFYYADATLVTIGSETVNVARGAFQLRVQVSNWTFANSSSNSSLFLDVEVDVSGAIPWNISLPMSVPPRLEFPLFPLSVNLTVFSLAHGADSLEVAPVSNTSALLTYPVVLTNTALSVFSAQNLGSHRDSGPSLWLVVGIPVLVIFLILVVVGIGTGFLIWVKHCGKSRRRERRERAAVKVNTPDRTVV